MSGPGLTPAELGHSSSTTTGAKTTARERFRLLASLLDPADTSTPCAKLSILEGTKSAPSPEKRDTAEVSAKVSKASGVCEQDATSAPLTSGAAFGGENGGATRLGRNGWAFGSLGYLASASVAIISRSLRARTWRRATVGGSTRLLADCTTCAHAANTSEAPGASPWKAWLGRARSVVATPPCKPVSSSLRERMLMARTLFRTANDPASS
mmetsp:Transcript_49023/g.111206  ORF Transcript_49023/g.111206 Transcript_49023/m.111206 type:complete len:211 (-) Transcript_49023:604-1236(-)